MPKHDFVDKISKNKRNTYFFEMFLFQIDNLKR